MSVEKIQFALRELFAAPLPEFYRRRIVFWKDPAGEFEDLLEELDLPGVKRLRLTENGRFAAKMLLSHEDLDSDYLVYNPFTDPPQEDWLRDVALYSEEFRADLTSLRMAELSIADSPVMRKTVRLYKRFLDSQDRRKKLRAIGRDYQTPLDLHLDILSVLAGCPGEDFRRVLIALLSAGTEKEENPVLQSIEKLGSPAAFWQMAERYTGFQDGGERPLADLCAHILLTALSRTAPSSSLAGLERFLSGAGKDYCHSLTAAWLAGEDSAGLWDLCRELEDTLNLPARFAKMEPEDLPAAGLFPAAHRLLLGRLFDRIARGAAKAEPLLAAAGFGRTSGWYPRFRHEYDCLWAAGRMWEFCQQQRKGFHFAKVREVWRFYTQTGWQVDTFYRCFRRSFVRALQDGDPRLEDALKQAAEAVEGLYQNWFLAGLTQSWTDAAAGEWAKLGYLADLPRQRRFYEHYVQPVTKRGSRAFVIISDALRYEVAVQLRDAITRETRDTASLEAVQGIFPTVTRFGMAALLPGQLLTADDRLEVLVDGLPTRSTPEREAVLQKHNPKSAALRCDSLLPMKRPQRRELVSGKEVVYLYHNTIDAIGDKPATESKVFEACEDAVRELLAIYRMVAGDFQATDIFITADHGFLYTARPLAQGEKVGKELVDGTVRESGRRYIIAGPGAVSARLLPIRLEDNSYSGFTPRNASRIRIPGGGEHYVHGGTTLQEMAVPVLVCKHQRGKGSREAENARLVILSETRRIANMAFRVDFYQRQPVGDKVRPCTYTLYFEDEEGKEISDRQQIIADREGESATQREFYARFRLHPGPYDRQKTYRLVVTNGIDLPEKTDYVIDVAFGDDFGFDL